MPGGDERDSLQHAARAGGGRLPIGALGAAVLLLAGCASAADVPSALDPRGPRAAHIAELWWVMLALASAVFVVVLLVLLIALFRRRTSHGGADDRPDEEGVFAEVGETGLVVVGGLLVPAVILAGLTVLTVRTLAATAAPASQPAVVVEVIGHLWWWEVRYPDAGFVTANEIRIPTGQPIELRLSSPDVIHSFWVPQLMGKLDLVPGRVNVTWVEADQPGVYRGLCAEFCGVQHAKMGFLLVAEPPERFAAWVEAQRRPAVEPTDPVLLQGAQVFSRDGCINCHVIRYGTGAVGTAVGPDLTHVGSRLTLGAGIMPNTRGHLAGWIGNPQALKPGNYMPAASLDGPSLLAVAAYLASLE